MSESKPQKKGCQVICTATIPEEEIKTHEQTVLEEAGKTMTFPGFREGKAPLEQVAQKLGGQKILEQIIHKAAPKIIEGLIEEHDIKPVIAPDIAVEKTEPLEIKIIFTERPSVKVKSFKLPKIEKVEPKEGEPPRDEKREKEQAFCKCVCDSTVVDLPDELIMNEMRQMQEEIAHQLMRVGMEFDTWLQKTGQTPEAFGKKLREDATDRLKLRLGLGELIEKKKVEISDEELDNALAKLIATLDTEGQAQAKQVYQKGGHAYEQYRQQLQIEKLIEEYV